MARWIEVHGHLLDNLGVALDWAFSAEGDAQLGIDLTVAAVPLWQRMSLLDECRTWVEASLFQLSGSDDGHREMQLRAALGAALALRFNARSMTAWADTLTIAERLGNTEYRLRALRGLWRTSFTSGIAGDAQRFARQFTDAVASESASLQRMGGYMNAMNSFYAGDLAAARLGIECSMRTSDAAAESLDVQRFSIEPWVVASANLSRILWLQGYPDAARAMVSRCVGYAESMGHGLSTAYALAWCACGIAIQTGDLPEAERCLHRLADQASWDSLGQWTLIHQCWTGVLRDRQGDPSAAAGVLAAALRDIPSGSFRLHHTRFLGEYAGVLGRIGRAREALDAVDTAITLCERLEERWFYAELLRIKGGIVLRVEGASAGASAEEQFTSALDWAGRQGAWSWALRAATSLASLKQSQGLAEEARALLTPIYGHFTEGFETADLQRARALLDRLT